MVGTVSAANALERVRYSHEAMIDILIAEPAISQGELAKRFGYTEPWISRVINSDAFQEALALRRSEVVNPVIVASLEERMKTVNQLASENLINYMTLNKSPEVSLKALEITSKALGFGARQQNIGQQVNNYVVAIPAKVTNAQEWAQAHGRAPIEAKAEEN